MYLCLYCVPLSHGITRAQEESQVREKKKWMLALMLELSSFSRYNKRPGYAWVVFSPLVKTIFFINLKLSELSTGCNLSVVI